MNSLYYFSGTGNSLYVAKKLAEKLDLELSSIVSKVSSDSIEGDLIGVVFPIYMFNAPRLVYEFFQKIRSCGYLFIVMALGGRSGKTTARINRILNKNNLELSAGFSVLMPDNYIVFNEAKPLDKQKEIVSKADVEILRISEIINKREIHFDNENDLESDPDDSLPFPINIMPLWLLQALFDLGYKQIPRMDKSFTATEKCNSCGICEKICPVNNIVMESGRPSWKNNCEQCMACIQWCPQEAIEYGRKTAGKKRYHNPEITLKEMMEQCTRI